MAQSMSRRWFTRAPHPDRTHRDGADGRRADARRRRPHPVDRPGRCGRHRQHPGRTLRGALGRHRQPGARHLLPGPGGDPAVRRARPARHGHRGRRRARARHGPVPARPPHRAHRDRFGQPRGRVPGTPARPVLRGHLRRRRQGCGAGHRTGRSPHVRAPHADPRRQRGRPRLRRRRAHDRRRAVPDPAAPRAAQHQRAARRQRHDRRRGSVAGLRRALLPRPRRPVAELRLGSPPLRRHRRDLRQPRCCPGARGSPSSWPDWPSTSSGSPSRRASASAPSAASSSSPPPRPRPRRRQPRRPTPRTTPPTWCSTSATSRSPFRVRSARSARCAA